LSCDGHAKLADLKYAKKMDDMKSHEMRTASESLITLSANLLITSQQGTMHFMSIEVAANRLLFPPTGFSSSEVDGFLGARRTARIKVPFSHNHLHDLESLWWVAVWVVFYNYFLERTPSGARSFTLKDAEGQLNLARILFPPAFDSAARQNSFQSPDFFQDTCDRLPGNKADICDGLDVLRRLLISHYEVVEARYPLSVDPNNSEDNIYDQFTQLLSDLKTISDFELGFIPDIYTIEKKKEKGESSKRARSESTIDSGVAQKKNQKT
jgi:hypothetical protein